jgi:hypothetical protein
MARKEHSLDLTLEPFLTDPYRSGTDCPFVGFTPSFACVRR